MIKIAVNSKPTHLKILFLPQKSSFIKKNVKVDQTKSHSGLRVKFTKNIVTRSVIKLSVFLSPRDDFCYQKTSQEHL